MKKKLFTGIKVAFVILLMVALLMPAAWQGAEAASFYDTFLSQCEGQQWFIDFINQEYIAQGKSMESMTSSDTVLSGITKLQVPVSEITKIPQAVQNLPNLQVVDLSGNRIADISPLYGCKKITELYIDENLITQVNLDNWPELKLFSARYNRITAMPDVSQASTVEKLDLSGNPLMQLSDVSGMTALSQLVLSNCGITDASGLGNIRFSEQGDGALDLSANQLTNLDFVEFIQGLKTLRVSKNFIGDISPLTAQTGILVLDISYNYVESVDSLAGFVNLQHLNLSHNQIRSLKALEGITSVITLDVSNNQLESVDGINFMEDMEVLNLSGNGLTVFPQLTLLTSLKVLDISDNQIPGIALLSRFTQLSRVYASGNLIEDIGGVSGLEHLVYADFSNNKVADIPVNLTGSTPSLKELDLSGNPLTQSAVERTFTSGFSYVHLRDMDLSGMIPDLSMSAYSSVVGLDLNGSTLTESDWNNIFARTNYTVLGIGGNLSETMLTRLKGLNQLTELDVSNSSNVVQFLGDLSELNLVKFTAKNCGLTELSQELLQITSIAQLNLQDNRIGGISQETLTEAFIRGVTIQLSNNLITEEQAYYSYFEYAGVVNLSGNLLRQNEGVTLKVDDAPELAPGDSFDLLSLVSIFDLYENEEIVAPDVNMITAKISSANTAKAQVIKENGTWMLKIGSDIEENFFIEVEISLAGGVQTVKTVFGGELDNPEDVLNIQWGMLDMDGMTGLYGFDLDTTMDELFEGFGAGSAYTYSAEDKNGQRLSGEDIVRTEAVVTLYKNGQPVAEYTLCLFGDVTGDGAINISDILAIKRHILAQRTIEGMGCAAADVNGDGSINISDLLAVKRDILGQRKIDQQRDS